MAIITHVEGDGCCCSGIVCGHTCSLFICKQTLVQYEEEKKKEQKKCQDLKMQMHLKPHPSSSWQLGNMMVAYAQSIYPLIKITSILKKKEEKCTWSSRHRCILSSCPHLPSPSLSFGSWWHCGL